MRHSISFCILVLALFGSLELRSRLEAAEGPPSITVQPRSQIASVGNTVTFQVDAVGTSPLSFQWFKDQIPIGSATSASFTLSNIKQTDAGAYSVVISNPLGRVTSDPAVLTVVGEGTNRLQNPNFFNGGFSVALPTEPGMLYSLEYKSSLTDQEWTPLLAQVGNGRVRSFFDPSSPDKQRFYRLEVRRFPGVNLPDPELIFAQDNRTNYFEEPSPLWRKLGNAVCLVTLASELVPETEGFRLKTYSWAQTGQPLCLTERFANETRTAFTCTAFLIGPDLVATAGHCVHNSLGRVHNHPDARELKDLRFVFGFRATNTGQIVTRFSNAQVYGGEKAQLLLHEYDSMAERGEVLDYAIIRLDRPVTATGAEPLTIRTNGAVQLGARVGVIGYPLGLPQKFAFGDETVVLRTNVNKFFSNADTFGGNSGSPVFSADTGVVEAIHVTGARRDLYPQLVLDVSANCYRYGTQAQPFGTQLIYENAGAVKMTAIAGLAELLAQSGTPAVTVKAATPIASEQGQSPGVFAIARSCCTAQPLTITYNRESTASFADYSGLTGSVIIQAGQTTAEIKLTPVDDSDPELTETVTIILNAGTGYTVGDPSQATMEILDNDKPVPSNQPPVASLQSVTVLEDSSVNITLRGTDPENDPLTFTMAGQPTSKGKLSGNPPNLTYTPAQDQNGNDSFAFQVSDGKTSSAAATVSINITPLNDPPTLDAIADVEITAGKSWEASLPGITYGPANENQAITVKAVSGDPSLVPDPVVSYTSPNTQGKLTLVPASNRTGKTTITVTVQDNGGTANGGQDTITRTFNVAVVVLPPVQITHQGPTQYVPGDTVQITNRFAWTGSLLSLLWRPQLPAGWQLMTGEAIGAGTLEMNSSRTAILWIGALPPSPIQMRYTVQVPATATGAQQIRGEVEYQLQGMVNAQTAFASPDPLPIAGPPRPGEFVFDQASYSAKESDGTLTISVRRINGSTGAVSVRYEARDGSAKVGQDYEAISGSLSWSNGDSANKTFQIRIVSDQAAESDESFTVALSNPTGDAILGNPNSATVQIIENRPPTISSISDQTIKVNTSSPEVPFTVNDAETPADQLQMSKTSSNTTLVSEANILLGGGGANRTVTITPAANQTGIARITLTVRDTEGLTASSAFQVTVAPDEPPKIVTSPQSQAVNVGAPVTFSVVASGTAPLTYQWRKNSQNISGATSSSYTIASVQNSDAGNYDVIVSNSAGSRTSQPATLTVTPAATTLWGMGRNDFGQLGDGTTSSKSSPVQIASGVSAVAAGEYQSLFVKTDGSLWAMGYNAYGQLGDGTTANKASPAQIAIGVSVAAGGQEHSLFVKTDGTLWAMGRNNYGQLGDGTTTDKATPVQIATGVSKVAAGISYSLFVKTDGTLWAMGYNGYGQLGDGTTSSKSSPVQIASGVSAVAAGWYHSLFVKNDGTLWTMGRNEFGQLGDGTTSHKSSPAQIALGVGAVAAGGTHSLFVKTDGTLWTMGRNDYSQLGDSTTVSKSSPVQIATGVGGVAAGEFHSLFLKTDGTLWAMGWNPYGQLGVPTISAAATPVQIATGVSAVAAGQGHSLFLRAESLTILSQPKNQSVSVGGAATFNVVATGATPLNYQWRKDGVIRPGATAPTLTITNVQPSDAGSYDVVVSDSTHSVTSSVAILNVTGGTKSDSVFRPGNIPNGLVGWWKLDETSGTRLDSSGKGNHLTDNNTVGSAVDDPWGLGQRSADFEAGSSEYLSISDAAQSGLDINGTDASVSVAVWVKVESLGTDRTILTKGNTQDDKWYQMGLLGSSGALVWSCRNTPSLNSVLTAELLSVGKWYHLAAVHDGAKDMLSVYINGNLAGAVAYAGGIGDNSDPFLLGTKVTTAGGSTFIEHFDGLMKDAAVWNRALSPLEIKSLAFGVDLQALAFRPGNVSTLPAAWWKLNEVSSGTAPAVRIDRAGSHHLTDNNTVGSRGGYVEGAGASFNAAASEYLSTPDSNDFNFGSGDFSLSHWVRFSTVSAQGFYHQAVDQNNRILYRLIDGNSLGILGQSGGVNVVDAFVPWVPAAGVWYHVAVTRLGSSFRFYVDGKQIGNMITDPDAFPDIASSVVLGANNSGGLIYFLNGSLADFAIWKGYALTSDEIAKLATGFPLQQAGIVSYWPLDENGGTRFDSIGSNHLTDNNAVAATPGVAGNAGFFERSRSQFLSRAASEAQELDLGNQAYSISAWVKPTSTSTGTIVGKWRLADRMGYRFDIDQAHFFLIHNNAGENDLTSMVPGTWYHGVVSWAGPSANLAFWSDGGRSRGDAGPTLEASAPQGREFRLGGYEGTVNYFDGAIDEVVIAKRRFRDEEIKALYVRGLNGQGALPPPTPPVDQPPVLTAQPQSQTVAVGANATFSVTAIGTAPLSYQWKKNGADFPGANSASLTLNNVQTTDAGSYTVVVSNSEGSVTSQPAELVVSRIFRPGDFTVGLVGWWKLDEASNGTQPVQRRDSSGLNNHLTDHFNVAGVMDDPWGTGQRSADFEAGSSQYLSISDAAQSGLAISGREAAVTVAVWVKVESLGAIRRMFSKGNNFDDRWYQTALGPSGPFIWTCRNTPMANSISTAELLSIGRWYHLAAVHDGANDRMSVYIDGKLAGTIAYSGGIGDNPDPFFLGANVNSLGAVVEHFDGLMKDAAV